MHYIPHFLHEAWILPSWRKERVMSKRIYIAGPITGVDGHEESFNKAAADLGALGFEAVNPIAPGLVEGADYKYYIDRGLRMLMECDAIYMLPGWRKSKGATLESFYAMICGLECYEQEDEDDE
jgi:hypothetical protein